MVLLQGQSHFLAVIEVAALSPPNLIIFMSLASYQDRFPGAGQGHGQADGLPAVRRHQIAGTSLPGRGLGQRRAVAFWRRFCSAGSTLDSARGLTAEAMRMRLSNWSYASLRKVGGKSSCASLADAKKRSSWSGRSSRTRRARGARRAHDRRFCDGHRIPPLRSGER